jgi:CRP-like cAMP-binding protein
VLEEDDALGSGLAPGVRPVARQLATAAVVVLDPGEHALQAWYGRMVEHGPGLLILRGVLAREVHACDRTATELLGDGDLLRPWDLDAKEPVRSSVLWRAVTRTELALLDARFADRTRPWPEIAGELLRRLGERADSVAMQRAIASHPRVDMRVAMILWHLARRFGRATDDGATLLAIPLTHRLIGELVGAERSPVSHAVGRLTRAGLVERAGDDWILRGSPADHEQAAMRPLPPHPH